MIQREPIWLIKELPGRMRFRFKGDKEGEPNYKKFLALPGVQQATFNKITKSLVVLYNENVTSRDQILKSIEKGVPEVKVRLELEDFQQPVGNALSHLIFSSLRKINSRVNNFLGGYADLSSLAPTLLLVWGVEELIRNPVMPKWYDILRASESMFNNYSREYPMDD